MIKLPFQTHQIGFIKEGIISSIDYSLEITGFFCHTKENWQQRLCQGHFGSMYLASCSVTKCQVTIGEDTDAWIRSGHQGVINGNTRSNHRNSYIQVCSCALWGACRWVIFFKKQKKNKWIGSLFIDIPKEVILLVKREIVGYSLQCVTQKNIRKYTTQLVVPDRRFEFGGGAGWRLFCDLLFCFSFRKMQVLLCNSKIQGGEREKLNGI